MQGTDLPELPAERSFTVSSLGLVIVSTPNPAGTEMALIGELDQATRPTFDYAVNQALRVGPPSLHLDLSELEFLAVTGARAFDEAHGRCQRSGGGLVLVNPARAVRRLLDLFGMTMLMIER
ncbi:MAG: STAS domain-containing protein [Actinomycetota bacterium]|nr:STAS domain-containing protein [Actinomycetota bacterium]